MMIPPGWKTYQLKDLVEINKTSLGKKHNYDWIEYIDTSSVVENRFDCFKILKANEAPSRAKRIVKVNDIIYSTVRPIQRHYGFIRQAKENTIASTGFAVITPTKIEPKFLYYYLARDEIVNYLNGVAETNTTTYPAFNASLLNHLVVTIPDNFNEQYRISTILSSLDDKIELNLQMNKTLEYIAQAIFKEWFIDFRFPGFDGELVDGVPKGWRYGILGEIVKNFDSQRIPVSSQERAKRKGIYPYYGAASLMDYIDDYLFDGIYLLMGEDGSVIDGRGYPVLQYVWGKFWVNNHAHVLQGKNPFSTEYIYVLLKGTSISNIVTGAVQPKINQGNLNSIKCIIPDNRVLQEFNKIVFPIFERIRFNHDEISTLSIIRDILLPKLITGKIRVA